MTPPPSAPAGPIGSVPLSRFALAALAFLLASTAAQSPAVWWHLAEGRRLLGTADFWHRLPGGPSPASGIYDLGCYFAHLASPLYGVVVAHALLAAGAVCLAFGGRMAARGLVFPAVAAVAVLAMGTRLKAEPATASLFLVALVVRLIPDGAAWNRRALIPLAVAFIVWANVDAWFVGGLLLVATTLLGRAFDSDPASRGRARGAALATVAVAATACLLNPFHVRAFALPADLLDGRLGSPFAAAYLGGAGLSPARLAFPALLGLGLLSFLLTRGNRKWERFLPWLAFAGLACWEANAVPFFAAVGGPLAARNLQEYLARATGTASRRGRRLVGRGVAVVLGGGFLVAAWPGWLQSPPYGPREWVVDPPEALAAAARTVEAWYRDGRLPADARVLHLSPASAQAFAWHAPSVPGLVDARLAALFQAQEPPADWESQLSAAGVRLVVVSLTAGEPDAGALAQLLPNPFVWPRLTLHGRVWVFGWRGDGTTEASDPFAPVFAGGAGLGAAPSSVVPDADAARPRHWSDAFVRSTPRQTTDRDEAANAIRAADASRGATAYQTDAAWNATQFAGLVGSASAWGGPGGAADAWLRLTYTRTRVSPNDPAAGLARFVSAARAAFAAGRDDLSAEFLHRAVRSGRRAVAADPTDAAAQTLLGVGYLRLAQTARERLWIEQFPEWGQVRRVQAVTAFHTAVTLDPTQATAHLNLAEIYEREGALDLALEHSVRYIEARGGDAAGAALAKLRAAVAERETAFAADADKYRIAARAEFAVQLGLVGRGRDLLLRSDLAAFGAAGAAFEMDLLLRTGRAAEVRDLELGDTAKLLDAGKYRWLRIKALAGTGQYAAALDEAGGIAAGSPLLSPAVQRSLAATAGRLVLDELRARDDLAGAVQRMNASLELGGAFGTVIANHRSDLARELLRGLLAYEAGDFPVARASFEAVLALAPEGTLAPPFPHTGIARQMLRYVP